MSKSFQAFAPNQIGRSLTAVPSDLLIGGRSIIAGTKSISTDGLSERKVQDVLIGSPSTGTGTRSISTDGLSERQVSGFLRGPQVSSSDSFQSISTDGLSERPVVESGFMANTVDGGLTNQFIHAATAQPLF